MAKKKRKPKKVDWKKEKLFQFSNWGNDEDKKNQKKNDKLQDKSNITKSIWD